MSAHPFEQALCSKQTCHDYCNIGGSLLYPEREIQARHARWVCPYLEMSVSPSHPHHHTGGSLGPMAPSSANNRRVSRPSPSMAQIPMPTPARLTRTAPQQCPQSLSPPSPPLPTRGGASLAEHRAATVLQCWKRRIWLRYWFDQQALLK